MVFINSVRRKGLTKTFAMPISFARRMIIGEIPLVSMMMGM